MTRYLLAGGGTAGHVNPLLAVADRLVLRDPEAVILILGTAEGLESRLVPARGYELLVVARLPFPRRPNADALRFPGRFGRLVGDIRALIREHRIDVVVGFGGYVSAPAYLAARRENVAIAIHEANARPGMANRLGARLTRFVGTAFRSARLPHGRFVGMPLRREIESLDRPAERREALEFFGLSPSRPTLLVTGGSQGALHINEVVNESAATIIGAGWQILHVTGERSILPPTGLAHYLMVPYCDRMDLALAAADLAVARAGAATVSEFSALGVPAVYVPLAIGNGEQRLNARDVVDAGGALIVDNAQFTPRWVLDHLVPLLEDRAAIAAMAARTLPVGVLDGADRMVDLVGDARASTVDLTP
ncbi:UDP-N-acetylglucosamine--N-acetylmuramyl-(pentapeptide) pyrophosphoryl-undecaprenol N-acetylglucosamine transferase [Lacisediminihabitans sp. H27-G8]|uniref:UDP-N-acetylglucosamine--N-acetylmuramyl- (pentapeptide) pyrophosphoryl-undecaprenol N-acetylglucosamine transferase n=1 Tax=Lacisediminihabitans sp. H27-G8 TaxID=3111909 RepID=UPI0038FD338D